MRQNNVLKKKKTENQVTTYTESSFGHHYVHSSHLQHDSDGQKCGQGRQLTSYSESAKSDHNNSQDAHSTSNISHGEHDLKD